LNNLSTLVLYNTLTALYVLEANANAITSATVINDLLTILDSLPSMDAGAAVNISDGTNAAPTTGPPDGIAAKNSLLAKLVNIYTN
jgi:hypothetical protein